MEIWEIIVLIILIWLFGSYITYKCLNRKKKVNNIQIIKPTV